jgi:hypothetical protein
MYSFSRHMLLIVFTLSAINFYKLASQQTGQIRHLVPHGGFIQRYKLLQRLHRHVLWKIQNHSKNAVVECGLNLLS